MLKQNMYEIEKNVERIYRGESTGFLTNSVKSAVEGKLKKGCYKMWRPFIEAEKVILYAGNEPRVRLFRIGCYKDEELRHSGIMGSLFGLNITSEMFGDIVKWRDEFYIYLLDDICELVINEFRMIGNVVIKLEEVSLDYLKDFEREYEKIELIVSSLRIDTVISRLAHCNRDSVFDKVRNQEIFINDELVRKASSLMEVGDIFSVRKLGKFRFGKIVGRTKKDNFIIEIDKYI